MSNHPNARVAGLTTLLTLGIIWICNRFGVNLSQDWAAFAAGAATTAVLWVGKEGIKGALSRLWNGAQAAWSGPAKKTTAAPKS